MNIQESIEYFNVSMYHTGEPTLSRMIKLMKALGNPQNDLRFIHVAGTNGKGSFCAMMDSILRANGYACGLYTSPYIREFRERIRFQGEMISEEDLAKYATMVQTAEGQIGETCTLFERVTATAFLYYKACKADPIVFEVGLGGRLDPTNVIQTTLLSVITNIDLDHTALLGNTISAIAKEKAGIIKNDTPVIYGGFKEEANKEICQKANEMRAPYSLVDRTTLHIKETSLQGTIFDYEQYASLQLPLLGSYQPINATIVLKAVDILNKQGRLKISKEAVYQGLRNVSWMARFEILRKENPTIIIDGGHNPNGVEACVQSIKQYFPSQKVILVSAVMGDKDYKTMLSIVAPIAKKLFAVGLPGSRALNVEAYKHNCEECGINTQSYCTVKEGLLAAIKEAVHDKLPVICLGSLYLYNEVCNILEGKC